MFLRTVWPFCFNQEKQFLDKLYRLIISSRRPCRSAKIWKMLWLSIAQGIECLSQIIYRYISVNVYKVVGSVMFSLLRALISRFPFKKFFEFCLLHKKFIIWFHHKGILQGMGAEKGTLSKAISLFVLLCNGLFFWAFEKGFYNEE